MMSLMICWDEMDPVSDTSTTSSSDDEQGDYSSQTAVSDNESYWTNVCLMMSLLLYCTQAPVIKN